MNGIIVKHFDTCRPTEDVIGSHFNQIVQWTAEDKNLVLWKSTFCDKFEQNIDIGSWH